MRAALGIDVGGTSIKAGLTGADGTLLARRTAATPRDPSACAAAIADLATRLRRDAPAGAEVALPVGVSVPGIVDERAGLVVANTNLGWRDLPVRELVARAVGGPVVLGHDVRAGAYGEMLWGAGTGDCLFVPLGTGIAAALVLDGRPVGSGYAGEIGHLRRSDPDDPDGPPLLVEQIAGAEGMGRRWARLRGISGDTGPGHPAGIVPGPAPGSAAVFAAAAEGDAAAAAVVAHAVETLAEVLATVLAQLGPLRVVIGGGASAAGESLLGPLREALARRTALGPAPEVVAAALGPWAGSLGTAALILHPPPTPRPQPHSQPHPDDGERP